jgi:predicted dehydrogenase
MSIGIVVVGPGLIGKKHIALLRANPDTHLAAIVAPDHPENHTIAAKEGVPLFHSLQKCATLVKLDGVIVSSPNAFHYEQARWCIEAKLPVLIEKPVTSDIGEAKILEKLVRDTNAKALVGHHRVYSPLLEAARQIIQKGRLGKLVSVVGSAQFYKPAHYFLDGPWRSQLGGGPILINMIHEVGNLRALMGEIVTVQAMASSAVRQFVVEDTVVINFGFSNGALGAFVLSDSSATPMSWEQTSRENSAYPTYGDVDCYTISGTQGSLFFPTMRIRYFPEGTEASWWSPFLEEQVSVERDDPLHMQLVHFVNLIRGQADPQVPVADGYRNLMVIEAIRSAISSGNSVKVGE